MNIKDKNGFSMLEMVVAITLGAIFLLSATTLSIAIESSMSATRFESIASDVSYRYLRKYVSVDNKPTWFACSTATGTSNTNDLTVNPNAAGQTVESGALTFAGTGLPEPVSYAVIAVAPYGCTGVNTGTPILVTSRITYGPNSSRIEQATYENY